MHFPHTQRLSAKKVAQNFVGQKNSITFASHLKKRHDSVAQLVEQMTLNHWVESSSLSGVTKPIRISYRLFYFLYNRNWGSTIGGLPA